MAEEWIYHHSYHPSYRKPFGAVACNKEIILHLRINSSVKPDEVILYVWQESEKKMKVQLMNLIQTNANNRWYQGKIKTPEQPGLLWYHFRVLVEGKTFYYGNNKNHYGGIGEITQEIPPAYQITVYSQKFVPPQWFKEAIIYQIFVDRFCNGHPEGKILNPKKNSLIHSHWENTPIYIKDEKGKVVRWDFFGGNLLGVKKKLPYLNQLGINVIYFNPIFESPSNHKYDTGDYHKIDPMYGDLEDFQQLCEEAKQMGISIILDGVFSHTGSDSLYFNKKGNYPSLGAYQSKDSPYYSWYRFKEYPHSYERWWGIEVLPNVNELDPSYLNFIIDDQNSVLKYWQRMGIKGWRLDVADELPDEFIQHFYQTMKEIDPDSVLIGEVWEDAANKISYEKRRQYLYGEELDSVTNYPLRNIMIQFILGLKDSQQTKQALMSLYENYPIHHFYSLMNIIGSHDTPRILTLLQDHLPANLSISEKKELAIKRLKLISLWQITFPGVPTILYGDEVGLEGREEPINRATYPWGKENVGLLRWYQTIIQYRHQYDVFKTGQWTPIYQNPDVFGYLRFFENGKDVFGEGKGNGHQLAIVIFNQNLFEIRDIKINLASFVDPSTCSEQNSWLACSLYDLLQGQEIKIDDGIIHLSLQPLKGKVLIQSK